MIFVGWCLSGISSGVKKIQTTNTKKDGKTVVGSGDLGRVNQSSETKH